LPGFLGPSLPERLPAIERQLQLALHCHKEWMCTCCTCLCVACLPDSENGTGAGGWKALACWGTVCFGRDRLAQEVSPSGRVAACALLRSWQRIQQEAPHAQASASECPLHVHLCRCRRRLEWARGLPACVRVNPVRPCSMRARTARPLPPTAPLPRQTGSSSSRSSCSNPRAPWPLTRTEPPPAPRHPMQPRPSRGSCLVDAPSSSTACAGGLCVWVWVWVLSAVSARGGVQGALAAPVRVRVGWVSGSAGKRGPRLQRRQARMRERRAGMHAHARTHSTHAPHS